MGSRITFDDGSSPVAPPPKGADKAAAQPYRVTYDNGPPKLKGNGTLKSPYDLSGMTPDQERAARAGLPQGQYYTEGNNIRLNEHGSQGGNPVVAQKAKDGQWYAHDAGPGGAGDWPRMGFDGGGAFLRRKGQRIGLGPQSQRGFGGYMYDEVTGAVGGSIDRAKQDLQPSAEQQAAAAAVKRGDYNPVAAVAKGLSPGNVFNTAGRDLKAGADMAAVPLSPLAGAIHGLWTRPVGSVLAKVQSDTQFPSVGGLLKGEQPRKLSPDERQAKGEATANQALWMIGPEAAGPAAPAARVGAVENALTRAPMAARVNAFDRAGVRPSLAAVDGGGASQVANAVSGNALAGVRARSALRGTVNDVSVSASQRAQAYGTSMDPAGAGEAVQQGVHNFNDRFSTRASNLYDKAFDPINKAEQARVATNPDASTVMAPETQSTLRAIAGRVNSPALSSLITEPKIKQIGEALANPGSGVRFGDIRALRTWVREAQKNPELRQGIGQGNLQRLEGALTTDIYGAAEQLAPGSARGLKRADQFYRAGNTRIRGALQSFIGRGSSEKAPEAAYNEILRIATGGAGADVGRLAALRRSLTKQEWGDVAASTIDQSGQPLPGSAEQGGFSVSRFVTNYSRFSRQARDLIYGTGAERKALDNLMAVAGLVKRVEKGANSSNTAVSLQNAGTLGGLVNPATTLPTLKVIGALAGAAEWVTNPVVVRWMANLERAGQAGSAPLKAATRQLSIAASRNAALVPLLDSVRSQVVPGVGLPAGAQEPNSPNQ